MECAIIFSRDLDIELITPEMVVVSILYHHNCVAARLLRLAQPKLPELKISLLEERFLELAQNQTSRLPAKLYFESFDNTLVQLSRESVILLDEALTIANNQRENRIDTDHILLALLQLNMSGSKILHEMGVTAELLTVFNTAETTGIYDFFG